MTCDDSREVMLDVLYGEEVSSRSCFQFFQHLDACSICSSEYGELLQTRELLQNWHVDDTAMPPAESVKKQAGWVDRVRSVQWWPALQKIAAVFLILVGATTILQNLGYLGGRRVTVSEQQLTEMVHDLVVVNQAEERDAIEKALIYLKEDTELQRRQDMQEVYNYLVSLEQRYAENLEENNRYLKTLLTR